MKVVSNSSPLIFLSAIGMLDILKDEFGEILVPEAVYDEVTSNELKGSNEVKHADWIKVQAIKNIELLSFLPMLDRGEESTIVLAIEQDADLVLLDNLAGRRAAMMRGLNVMGTLGFLKVMHRKGMIKNFKDVLDSLQKYGFWMVADLYNRMLEE
jgi:predicted nucleic acid-binding protein